MRILCLSKITNKRFGAHAKSDKSGSKRIYCVFQPLHSCSKDHAIHEKKRQNHSFSQSLNDHRYVCGYEFDEQ